MNKELKEDDGPTEYEEFVGWLSGDQKYRVYLGNVRTLVKYRRENEEQTLRWLEYNASVLAERMSQVASITPATRKTYVSRVLSAIRMYRSRTFADYAVQQPPLQDSSGVLLTLEGECSLLLETSARTPRLRTAILELVSSALSKEAVRLLASMPLSNR